MGKEPRKSVQSLNRAELDGVTRALDLDVPPDAVLQGVWWHGEADDTQLSSHHVV
ncbi:MAG: hypothetical protein K0R38_2012 [Polyangiaceae bacterium]|jgi:hypothetical protein|nr:hypothetical protein [Polyangiaceae bacterium]